MVLEMVAARKFRVVARRIYASVDQLAVFKSQSIRGSIVNMIAKDNVSVGRCLLLLKTELGRVVSWLSEAIVDQWLFDNHTVLFGVKVTVRETSGPFLRVCQVWRSWGEGAQLASSKLFSSILRKVVDLRVHGWFRRKSSLDMWRLVVRRIPGR